jgi:heat-inducible transcriptional repressor
MVQLEGRRREILKLVIDDYILTAEPIGSEAVRERHRLTVSSATVRNEMAALEDLGFLHQPHPSAGRIPTDLGYRVYVDSMLQEEEVPLADRTRIRRTFASVELDRAFEQAARALAVITDCASVVAVPRAQEQVIRHLHLVPLGERRAFAVVVTDTEIFEGTVVEFDGPITADECERLSQEISRRIAGRPLSDLIDRMTDQGAEETVFSRVVDHVSRLLHEHRTRPPVRILTEGAANILKQPEFRDVRRAHPVLSALERDDVVEDLLFEESEGGPVWIRIGMENRHEEMKDCSVVAATYHTGTQRAGVVGVVGPTRLRYGKMISLVRFLADTLADALSQA